MSSSRITVAALALAAALFSGDASAQTGSVSGTVTRSDTQAPLNGVQVFVVGTNRTALTNEQGRYLIPSVPVGTYPVRASVIGFEQGEQSVTVTAGSTATADFAVRETALELGAIVVNAVTGQIQTKREIAASVGTIDVAKVELAPVHTMADLMQGRVAGAVVLNSSGTTGGGSRVRIRGANSLSLNNAPLIIVDNVRVDNEEFSFALASGATLQQPSRLDDLNPEDIETIDVLKGPAATSLYGTAAANGVIVVTTRRGRPGAPQVRVWAEYGELHEQASFPDNVYAEGNLIGATNDVGPCYFYRQAISNPVGAQIGCTGVTRTFRFNPLENDETTPFRTGRRRSTGASASGGTDATRFYVSGEYEEEAGALSSNDLKRIRVQTNLNGEVGPKLSLGSSFSFLQSKVQIPQSDNAIFGIVPMGLSGSPLEQAVEETQGFASDPAFAFEWPAFQSFSRFTGSMTGTYRPLSWLTVNGIAGLDRHALEEEQRVPRVSVYNVFGQIFTEGFIELLDTDIYHVTSNATATAIFNPTPDIVSTSSVGASYTRDDTRILASGGAFLTPGVETSLAGATVPFEANEANVLNSTVGAHLQQQFAWRDRVFLNAALRGDQNTAFGSNIGWIWYPGVSASWMLSEEPFFPTPDWLGSVRLRTAWGQSGLRPGATDALQSFTSAVAVFNNQPVAAIVIDAIGNADLEPERSTEIEAGLDADAFDGRLGLEATVFHKVSRDALVNRPLPGSLGGTDFRFENLGRVDNKGLELRLNGTPLRNSNLRWDVGISGSFLKNRLVDIGNDAGGRPIPPIPFGLDLTQRHAEGYPLGGYWHFPIDSIRDRDGNGLLRTSEIYVSTDTVSYLGNPFPTREFSFNTTIGYRDWVRLSALLDYKGGHRLINYTRGGRCGDALNCAELYDPNTPLVDQAAILAYRLTGSFAGFVEDADFVKLREVSLVFGLPSAWARRANASRITLTLAGRNLKTWTDYRGFDPEVSFAGQANFSSGDYFTLPPNRIYTIRLDTTF